MTEITRPVLRYHGGKFRLAPWIVAQMPPHRIYVEPYGGAGSVLLHKPRSYAEVYNDRWETVVNVFRVLRDPQSAAKLTQLLELTPFSRDEFFATYESDETDPIEKARQTILRSFAGFGSAATSREHRTGFRGNIRLSGSTPAQDWRNYPSQIVAFVERLQGVTVENMDACLLIERHDSADTLFYVDPPYPHVTRDFRRSNAAYVHEMTDADHEALAAHLHQLAGMVMTSSYRCDLYSRLYSSWRSVERSTHCDGAGDRVEILWMNEHCARCQSQARMFA